MVRCEMSQRLKSLRKQLTRIVHSALVACFVAGCADESPTVSKPYKAKVLSFKNADSQEKGVQYTFETKELKSLENLNDLQGKYFGFVNGGELVIKAIEGSQVESDSFTGGGKPKLRYTVEDGTIVARDYRTLILLSAFHEFEQVFLSLDKLIGQSPDKFVASSGPIKIMFEPKISIEDGGTKIDATIKLNAAFVPGKNQFILFRRSNVENVPLAANLQVVAHELGHALFERSFFKGKYEGCDPDEASNDRYFKGRYSGEYSITGLNEGFADIVSWSMTGSTDILRSSIDIKDVANQRDFARTTFKFSDLVNQPDNPKCEGSFYCVGTLFAKSVREAAVTAGLNTKSGDVRKGVMRDVFASVSGIQDQLKTADTQVFPPPADSVKRCERERKDPTLYDGQIAGAFLYAFLNGIEASKRKAYCTAFQKNFGTSGFPESTRGLCL